MNLNNNITAEDQRTINDLTNDFFEFEFENENDSFSNDSINFDSFDSINIDNLDLLNNETTKPVDKKNSYTYGDRIEYFKNQLSDYYTNNKFLDFLSDITIKNVLPVKNAEGFYEMYLNNSSKKEILLGPLNRTISQELDDDFIINMDTMTIPMRHTHLNEKLNFAKTDFYYTFTGEEERPIKRFIEQVRQFEDYLIKLIHNYITNIKENSPIYELVKKYNKNWYYYRIIYESGNKEYLTIHYNKESYDEDFKIGTRIYHGEELVTDLMDQLADDTKNTYISGYIYPIIKISTITVYEKNIKGRLVLTFKPKVFFADILVKKNTLKYGIINNHTNSSLEQCKELLSYYNSKIDFSEFLNEITINNIVPLKQANNLFNISVKNINNTPIFIGPILRSVNNEKYLSDNNNSDFTIDLNEMTLPMRHYHLNEKLQLISSSFYYIINDNENDTIKFFLNQVKQIDQHLNTLIRNYIINMDEKSPLYSILQKNKYRWIYNGMIKKTKDNKEIFSIDYYKRDFNKSNQIGTKIYNETELIVDIMEQLADDSKNTYVYGDIYPLIKIDSIIVYEMQIEASNFVCFKTKAHFVNIIAKKNTLRYGIYSPNIENASNDNPF